MGVALANTSDKRRYGLRLGQIKQSLVALLSVMSVLLAVGIAAYLFDVDSPQIVRVQATSTGTPAPPSDGALWREVDLPWRLCPPSRSACYDHYRLVLPNDQAGSLGLFVPSYVGSLAVHVNGQKIAQFGELQPPVEIQIFKPRLISIPQHLLQARDNLLLITLGADRGNYLRLSPFYIGRLSELEPIWRLAHWLSVDLLVASTGVYIVLGIMALVIFQLSRDNLLALWFVGIVFCAAARNTFFFWTDPQFDLLRAFVYFQASLGELAAILGFVGTLARVGRSKTYFGVLLSTLGMTAALVAYIAGDTYEGTHFANRFTHIAAIGVGVFSLVWIGRYAVREWHMVKPWVLALFAAAFLLTVHDIVPTFLSVPVHYQLSNLAPLFLVVAFCFILAHQLAEAVRRVKQHNEALAAAVDARESELHDAYAQIRHTEQEQVLGAERLRILQDVHDGVGGRLAGLVLMARRSGDTTMALHIEESLADLRLIIESLDEDMTKDLALALAAFAQRAKALLDTQGIQLHCSLRCPESIEVTPSWLMAVLRAMQEALHNVIRHAQAYQAEINIVLEGNQLRIDIVDDGVGIPEEVDQRQNTSGSLSSRGFKNITRRMSGLGGSFEIVSLRQPTKLRLVAPLPAVLNTQTSTPRNMGVQPDEQLH